MDKNKLSRLSEDYLAALCSHLSPSPPSDNTTAIKLGTRAVLMGLETLDLVKVHEQALAVILPAETAPGLRTGIRAEAEVFFLVAILPVEETHRVVREATADLVRLNKALEKLHLDISVSKQDLQHEIKERNAAEVALKASERTTGELSKESRILERNFKDMIRKTQSTTELEKQKISTQLGDKIAKTLNHIHVSLLGLKNEAAAKHSKLAQEISITRRVVESSMRTIQRFAKKFGVKQ